MNTLKKTDFLNEDYFVRARENMLLHQLIPFGVKKPALLQAFSQVPRELFLEESQKQTAYTDTLIPLKFRGTMIPPHFLGRLLQEACLDGQGKALVIGGGSGYSAALLSHLMSLVFLLESHKVLALKAEENMQTLGLDNVFVTQGALAEGLTQHASFDMILIEGAVDFVPTALFNQLTREGVLLTFITKSPFIKEATCFIPSKNTWIPKILFEGNIPSLQAFSKESGFSF